MKSVVCPFCMTTVGEQIGGKLALGLTAAAFGSRVNPVVAAIAGIVGAWLGHRYIDSQIKCPNCGMVLQIATGLL